MSSTIVPQKGVVRKPAPTWAERGVQPSGKPGSKPPKNSKPVATQPSSKPNTKAAN